MAIDVRAHARSLPAVMGHRGWVRAFRDIVQACVDMDVQVLTAYAFSVENWKRSTVEVEVLLSLFEYYSREDRKKLHGNNVRFRLLGAGGVASPKSCVLCTPRRKPPPKTPV